MSYTAEDALLNIFRIVKGDLGIVNIKHELLNYFEKENSHPIYGGQYDKEIEFLKGGLNE